MKLHKISMLILMLIIIGITTSFGQSKNQDKENTLYIVKLEGREQEIILDPLIKNEDPSKLELIWIKSISVLKDDSSTAKYRKGGHGDVVIIELKKQSEANIPEEIKKKFRQGN